MNAFFIRTNKNMYGPLEPNEGNRYIRLGLFTGTDQFYQFASGGWVRLSESPALSAHLTRRPARKAAKIIAIASGKGGVGKTAVTASMALELARLGKRVILVDADFGGPDLHEWMGVSRPDKTLHTLFREKLSLPDVLVDTPYRNIKMICGEVGHLEASNPRYFQRLKLLRQLRQLDADFVLIDHSPGVSYNTIDIFLSCDEGVIVTLPEATSYMDAFTFIRSALLRKLRKALFFSDEALRELEDFENWDWRKYEDSMREVLIRIERSDPHAGAIFKNVVHFFRPRIITNMVFSKSEIKQSESFVQALSRLFMISAEAVGFIAYQKEMRRMMKQERPFLLTHVEEQLEASEAKESKLNLIYRKIRQIREKRTLGNGKKAEMSELFSERNLVTTDSRPNGTRQLDLKMPVSSPSP